jgi:hypothetical protein
MSMEHVEALTCMRLDFGILEGQYLSDVDTAAINLGKECSLLLFEGGSQLLEGTVEAASTLGCHRGHFFTAILRVVHNAN